MSDAKIIWLPSPSGNDEDDALRENLTRGLVFGSEYKAAAHGWPAVLDALLSAYLSLAFEQIGPESLCEMLSDRVKEMPRFAAIVRAQGDKPKGNA